MEKGSHNGICVGCVGPRMVEGETLRAGRREMVQGWGQARRGMASDSFTRQTCLMPCVPGTMLDAGIP